MKTKVIYSTLLFLFFLGINVDMVAQQHGQGNGRGKGNGQGKNMQQNKRKNNPNFLKTRAFLKKTNKILKIAHQAHKDNKVNCGGCLKKAFEHEKKALKIMANPQLFNKPLKKAMLHSWKARRLAFISLRKNGVEIKKKWKVGVEEVTPPLTMLQVKKILDRYNKLETIEKLEAFENDEEMKQAEVDIAAEDVEGGSDDSINPDELDTLEKLDYK